MGRPAPTLPGLSGRPRILYAVGTAGVVAALVGEFGQVDGLAIVGYLVAIAGLLGGFRADRRRS